MHELMNALGLHYWAMRGLPAPFLAAITTAINPYVGDALFFVWAVQIV